MSIDIGKIEKGFIWVDHVIKYFKHYHPHIARVTMDYKHNTSNFLLSVDVSDKFKRQLAKIKIPGSPGMSIISTKDMYYSPINIDWKFNKRSNEWILSSRDLPKSDRYFFEMTGPVPPGFFKDHIQIDRATQRNRENDDTCDSYWLCASLCQTKDLELISKAFEINEVNVGIDVKIGNHITPFFPKSVKELLIARSAWEQAPSENPRSVNILKGRYRRAIRNSNVSFDELVNLLNNIVEPLTFEKYLDTDSPYSISEIQRKENTLPPRTMFVEAHTILSLTNQTPKGFLRFNKKNFKKDLIEKLGTDD